MLASTVWLGEIEDKLRIAPCSNRDWRSSVADQRVADPLNGLTFHVCSDQKRPALYPLLPSCRVSGLQARAFERARDVACDMTRRFAERGRQRAICNDRPHSGYDDGNCGDEMSCKLTQA